MTRKDECTLAKKIVNFNLIRSFCTLETWPLIGSINNFIYCAQESQEI